MTRQMLSRTLCAGALFTLCTAVAAGAADIDDAGITVSRGARATHGSGILRMVTESIEVRPLFARINGTAVPGFVEIALDHILTSGRADVFLSTVLSPESSGVQLAAIPQAPSAELLRAPGISSISVAGKKTIAPWNLVPDQSEGFLKVAFGMMALGFVPTALRRSR